MILRCIGHTFRYEMENVCRIFYPYDRMTEEDDGSGRAVDTIVEEIPGGARLTVRIRLEDRPAEELHSEVSASEPDFRDRCELGLAVLLYEYFTKTCGFVPKWGILTGVRPIKLMRRLMEELGEEGARNYFRDKLLVSPSKIDLSVATAHAEQAIVNKSRPDSFSLYVSVPFCPTRCSYCSFVSQSIQKAAKLLPEYVDRLCDELEATGKLAKELGLRLETVYYGGGTPTTFSAPQLARVIKTIEGAFDLSHVREYTVEAGRPDTITREKLEALRDGGVTRISINPQTMNDDVLERIGRRHSAAQTIEAFELARQVGMNNINMDTIAGLPGDTVDSFRRTMEILTGLDPESITVHTLAIKHAAYLNHEKGLSLAKEAAAVDEMVNFSQTHLTQAGHRPYYLYRQSKMLGNLENVGWAKPGYECLYNVYIMEETHTILACGAGATTKLRNPYTDQIERIFNYKFPYEYNSRFGEMLDRKEKVRAFYASAFHK
jgi:oxygen-independent coproporphyrinogen-3 oxidase